MSLREVFLVRLLAGGLFGCHRGELVMPLELWSSDVFLLHQIANELIDALVIKDNRGPSRCKVNSHTVPDQQGVRVIHLKPVPVHQCHGKWPKWAPSLECVQASMKVVRFH
jgi:hypothetical protein